MPHNFIRFMEETFPLSKLILGQIPKHPTDKSLKLHFKLISSTAVAFYYIIRFM